MAQNVKHNTGGKSRPRGSSSRGSSTRSSSSRGSSSRSSSSRSSSTRSSSSRSSSARASSTRSASSRSSSSRTAYSHSGRRIASGSSGAAAIDRRRAAEDEGKFSRAMKNVKDFIGDCVAVAKDRSMGFDLPLLILILTLVAVGTTMMYSASYAYAYYHYGSSYYFIKSQLIYAAVGFVLMALVSFIPAEKLTKFVVPVMIVTYILLIIVRLLPAGKGGVYRWIKIGKVSIQPSEIAKLAIIMAGAKWGNYYYEFKRRKRRLHEKKFANAMLTFVFGIGIYLLITVMTSGLVLIEKHISCTVIILLLAATMMWMAGVDWRIFAAFIGLGVIAVAVVILSGKIGYSSARIKVWIDPFAYIDGDGWQNVQAIYAISSGGLLGQGIGNSKQKFLYIPEPQNDFVFAVVCEELGFIGATVIILLFIAFVWRGFTISVSNSDRFSKLLGVGITAQVGWQTLLNVAVVTKTIPNTGISLPFFSYGGTSIIMLLFEMGILLSVSRRSTEKQII